MIEQMGLNRWGRAFIGLQAVKKLYLTHTAIDDGRQAQDSPICIQHYWVYDRVVDDGHKALQLLIVHQIMLHLHT